MKFDKFLNQAWTDHAQDSAAVARRIPEALSLISENSHVIALAAIITHVFGEHLASWDTGLALLKTLGQHPKADGPSRQAIERSAAILRLAQSDQFLPSSFAASDQARIYATAAAARLAHGQIDAAIKMLNTAQVLCAELENSDPAQRALAVTGNNLAVSLEEKAKRSPRETEVMLMAASLGLEKWKLAGGWSEIQTANYRMAKSLIQAGDSDEALEFAQECLKICKANNGGPFEFFCAYECLASIEIARSDTARFHSQYEMAHSFFNKLSDEQKGWAQADLARLRQFISLN